MSERSEAEMARRAVEATGNLSNLSSDDQQRIRRLLGKAAVGGTPPEQLMRDREQLLRVLGKIASGG